MDIKKLADTLHPLERIVLPKLAKHTSLKEIVDATGLQEVEVMRALQWLQNKNIIKLKVSLKELVILDKNGKEYISAGLPEVRLLKSLKKKSLTLEQAQKAAKIVKQELNASIGLLKSKAAVEFYQGKLKITKQGKQIVSKPTFEENLLQRISEGGMDIKDLSDEGRFAYQNLAGRKEIIKTAVVKAREAELTDLGKQLARINLTATNVIDRLTPEMLKEESWKDKTFRRYDVRINVPSIFGGKTHFVTEAINYIKKIWLELGFAEMQGSIVQTAFWDLDALFVPQDHPARQMQDTFYIKNPSKGSIPKNLARRIKAVHENGGDTGSLGWQSPWSEEKAKENLLRTHTTVLSARAIEKVSLTDLPVKLFSVGKVFRNETLDWKHLFEFYQVEGIVVDPDANLKHLKGYLKEFYSKMGYPDVRVRPAHFPYTEPSMEVDVLHPEMNEWIELGGAGIFRPEVVKPLLGKEVPVLAWGLGMPRIISGYYGITDIRDLYRNDLKQIRKMKAWLL